MNSWGDRRINEGDRGGWGEWIGLPNYSGIAVTVTVTGTELILLVFRYRKKFLILSLTEVPFANVRHVVNR